MSTMSNIENDDKKAGKASFLKRFRRDRKGTVAIEFAMLALPFSLLVFAILESCISFAGQEVMANATDDIARELRTGQIKPPLTMEQLKLKVCDKLEIVVSKNCPGLLVDLRHYPSFADAATAKFTISSAGDIVLMKSGIQDTRGFVVDPGLSQSKNMLRVFYKWPVITDFMSKTMANLKDGATLHFSSVTWQNEPFDD